MTSRQRIITEAHRRLTLIVDASKPATGINVRSGDSGIDIAAEPKPAIFTFEARELTNLTVTRSKGLYRHALPVQIEYFKSTFDENHSTTGKIMLEALRDTLELDKHFLELSSSEKLCTRYGMTENSIVELEAGTVLLVVSYEFIYYTKHRGY